jgi:hypothetical protein
MQEQSRFPKTGFIEHFQRVASALLIDVPLFWMDPPLFWLRASRGGYGHRWPFSLRIVNKSG